MNNGQRKVIEDWKDRLSECVSHLEEIPQRREDADEGDDVTKPDFLLKTYVMPMIGVLEDMVADIEDMRDDEQSKYDNLSESLQNSERGEAMQYAAEQLEQAAIYLETATGDLGELRRGLEKGDIDDDAFSSVAETLGDVISYLEDAANV